MEKCKICGRIEKLNWFGKLVTRKNRKICISCVIELGDQKRYREDAISREAVRKYLDKS